MIGADAFENQSFFHGALDSLPHQSVDPLGLNADKNIPLLSSLLAPEPQRQSAAVSIAAKGVSKQGTMPINRTTHGVDQITGIRSSMTFPAAKARAASAPVANTRSVAAARPSVPFYEQSFFASWDEKKTPEHLISDTINGSVWSAFTIKEGQSITIDIGRDWTLFNVRDGGWWTSDDLWLDPEIWKTFPSINEFMEKSPPPKSGSTNVSITANNDRKPFWLVPMSNYGSQGPFVNAASSDDYDATTGRISVVGVHPSSSNYSGKFKPGKVTLRAKSDDYLEGNEYFHLKVGSSQGPKYYTFIIEDQSPGSPASLLKGTKVMTKIGAEAAADFATDLWNAVKERDFERINSVVYDRIKDSWFLNKAEKKQLQKNIRTAAGVRG
jgi:hypothetical protein